MLTIYSNKKMPKNAENAENYKCIVCSFECSKLSNWNKHLSTHKHKKNVLINQNQQLSTENSDFIMCNECNKHYKDRTGLWRHLKKFHKESEPEPIQAHVIEPPKQELSNTLVLDTATVLQLIKQNDDFKTLIVEQNQEFKALLLEQQNKIIDLAGKPNTINNTVNSNNTFNLQVFLNETCKDAMNISEFIENLNIQLKELENVGNNGYVTGISDIILKRIKGLDVSKRPLHCTDMKRETMYIRDENEWNKDNEEKTKLKKFVEQVANKNYKKIPEWCEKNPECRDMYHEKYEYCMQMMRHSLGDLDEKQDKLYDKVIKNIARQVTVDKNTITNE
jgi:hypothetical protein